MPGKIPGPEYSTNDVFLLVQRVDAAWAQQRAHPTKVKHGCPFVFLFFGVFFSALVKNIRELARIDSTVKPHFYLCHRRRSNLNGDVGWNNAKSFGKQPLQR